MSARGMVEEDIYEPSEAEQLRWAIGVLEKRERQSALMARVTGKNRYRDPSIHHHHVNNQKAIEIALKHLRAPLVALEGKA